MIKSFISLRFSAIIGLLSIILILSACSSQTENSNKGTSSPPTESSQSENKESEPAFPRTIEAANGNIVIEKKPERVAIVHWGYLESILLFDLKSLGLALPFTEDTSSLKSDAYKPYIDKHDEIVILGENTTVNMEVLLQYEPDIIIAGNSVNVEIANQLEKIAPTVVINEAKIEVWSNWPLLVSKLGEILGQETVAKDFITGFENKIANAKDKLKDVDGSVIFLQIREKEAYLGGVNTMTSYYDKGIGLRAPNDPNVQNGYQMSLEGLAALDPDHLFLGYFNYDAPGTPSLSVEWEKSEVWKKLKAVKENHVYGFNGILGMGFGPIGQSYGVDSVVEALLK